MLDGNTIRKIKKQNRIKFFESENKNFFMYDALSQNIFPVDKELMNLFNDKIKLSEVDDTKILSLIEKLIQWNGKMNTFSKLPETHLTINFSNKCNLNCRYCYRHKDNKNVMELNKAFDVLEYTNKYFKTNNDEIIFSLDMTAEAFLDYDKIVKFDDKLAEYENLYIEESEIVSISPFDFLKKLKSDLYCGNEKIFVDDFKTDMDSIILDHKLFSYFKDKSKVHKILNTGNYDTDYLDKKRLLRLNRELLESFYPKYLRHRKYQHYRIWFMSNGTCIRSKDIELIKRIQINPFWISLDGPENVHNKNRRYYDKRGSYEDVIKNIELLNKNSINVKISCVLTSDYPYPDKLYKYFKNLNAKAVQMCPIRNGNKNSFSKSNIKDLLIGYKNLYDILFTEIKNNDFSGITLLGDDLTMLALVNLFQRIRQNCRCTWGSEVVLDSKGDMYPCLYVIENRNFLLGNIDDKKKSEEILTPIFIDDMDKCSHCWARYLCGGTCYYNNLISKNNVYSVDNIECKIRKTVITYTIDFLIRLIENGINLDNLYKALIQR